jgi:hypothetical protein
MDAKHFDYMDSAAAKMKFTMYTTKIQAVWRGYRSRKGQVLPCCDCGHAMTLAAPTYPETMSAVFSSTHPCSWCQANRDAKEKPPCDCMECKMDKVMWCPGCGSDECDGLCRCDPCNTCGSEKCCGDCEPYISCCMCGANCYDGDYPSWRFCSRSCMVEASRD